jgi:hypothetical protein
MIRVLTKSCRLQKKFGISRHISTRPPQKFLGTLWALSEAEDAQSAARQANDKNRSLEKRVTHLEAEMKLLQLHVEQTTNTVVPRTPPPPPEPESECVIL